MTTAQFVKKYISTLEHFLEQGGWPCRVDSEEALALTTAIKAFSYKDGIMTFDKKKGVPDKILVEFWKFKYKERNEESNKLYSLIDDAYRKANN